jgi:hypothetical protein
MNRPTTLAAISAAALLASALQAAPTLIYSNDFEASALASEWSANYRRIEDQGSFSIFNGRYSQGWTGLTINAPTLGSPTGPAGPGTSVVTRYTLVFDLYVIDSWDASNWYGGYDHFLVSVNGNTVVDWGFTNTGGQQRNPLSASQIGNLGFGETAPDAIYRNVTLSFDTTPGQNLFIKFFDQNLGGVSDEGWGIDNVKLYGEALRVPTPSVAMGLGAGLTLALRRRRTK